MRPTPVLRVTGLALFLALSLSFRTVHAQGTTDQEASGAERLRVYLDCPRWICDFDYIRREIPYTAHVRNRQDAQVHILVTTQETGGGGDEYTFTFLGREGYEHLTDTLRVTTGPTATDSEERSRVVQTIKAGLVPYLAEARLLHLVRIVAADDTTQETTGDGYSREEDPWNFWSFRVSANGWFTGEQRRKSYSLSGSVSADRVTRAWKIELGSDGRYQFSEFETRGRTVINEQRNYAMSGLVVKSLTPHWSVGGRTSGRISTFRNYDLALELAPALEYNIFPYHQSSRREVLFRYAIGGNYFDYRQPTIFDRTAERRGFQSLTAAVEFTQPWGTFESSAEASHYLHDFSRQRLEIDSDLELRVLGGLSLNLSGSLALIRDQLYLPRAEATEEDVLLERRQLETSYDFFVFAGLSYRFGSIYNDVVNPRFDEGGGGGGRGGRGRY